MFDKNQEAVANSIKESEARLVKIVQESEEALAQIIKKTDVKEDIKTAADKVFLDIVNVLDEIRKEFDDGVEKCTILHDKVAKIVDEVFGQMKEKTEERIDLIKKAINY